MPGALEKAVLAAIEAAGDDVEERDAATVALACSYARAIDLVPEDAGQERTKAMYLGPHLLNALRELGCTPMARKSVKQVASEVVQETPAERMFRVVKGSS